MMLSRIVGGVARHRDRVCTLLEASAGVQKSLTTAIRNERRTPCHEVKSVDPIAPAGHGSSLCRPRALSLLWLSGARLCNEPQL